MVSLGTQSFHTNLTGGAKPHFSTGKCRRSRCSPTPGLISGEKNPNSSYGEKVKAMPQLNELLALLAFLNGFLKKAISLNLPQKRQVVQTYWRMRMVYVDDSPMFRPGMGKSVAVKQSSIAENVQLNEVIEKRKENVHALIKHGC